MSYLLRAAAEAIKNEAHEIANDANKVAVPRELIGLLVGALRATPPAQPASPGPLQPGASRVTGDMVDAAIEGYASCGKGGTHFEAIRAALEAALSAGQGKTGEDQ